MSEEEKRKLVLDNISKEALVNRVNFFFVREKYYRERTYDLENIIDKAIEKLYLWGETLNPTFQKEMLEILGGSDE